MIVGTTHRLGPTRILSSHHQIPARVRRAAIDDSLVAVAWRNMRCGRRGRVARALGTGLAMVLVAAVQGCTGTSDSQVAVRSPDDVEAGAGQATTTTPPDCAEMLPPEGQASQLLMVMTGSPAEAAPTISGGLVGGFGLKGNQSEDVGTEVATAIAEAPLTPIVASDEEGGTVQRLRSAIGQIPSARELAKKTPAEAAAVHAEHAAAMKALGFTMDFAPVADVGSGSDLGSRSFGNDPTQVSSFVNAVFPAIAGAGVTPVVKHWPGLGAGNTDPHDALGTLADVETLRARDLLPFDAAIASGVPAIMVTHAEVPGLTAEGEPTSLSTAAITGELRGRQGFTGLVITDSLGMGAVADLGTQADLAEATISPVPTSRWSPGLTPPIRPTPASPMRSPPAASRGSNCWHRSGGCSR